jgi:predicted ATPase
MEDRIQSEASDTGRVHPSPLVRLADADRPPPPPAPLAPFVGREREIADIRALLRAADVRLLTLVGPGGVGKTRLALASVSALRHEYADGIWFVDLSAIRDAAHVAAAIAQTLGIRQLGDRPLSERLEARLLHRQALLLLDNFEQVVEAAPLVSDLLTHCVELKALVTSRTPLHAYGERRFPVPPWRSPLAAWIPTRRR